MKMLLIWLPIIRDVAITVFLCVLFYESIHKRYTKLYDFKIPVSIVDNVAIETKYSNGGVEVRLNEPIDIRVRN